MIYNKIKLLTLFYKNFFWIFFVGSRHPQKPWGTFFIGYRNCYFALNYSWI